MTKSKAPEAFDETLPPTDVQPDAASPLPLESTDEHDADAPYCAKCETLSYAEAAQQAGGAWREHVEALKQQGWHHFMNRAGMVRRCPTCSAEWFFRAVSA